MNSLTDEERAERRERIQTAIAGAILGVSGTILTIRFSRKALLLAAGPSQTARALRSLR